MKKSKILIFLLTLAVCNSGTAVGKFKENLKITAAVTAATGTFFGSLIGGVALSTVALPVTFSATCAKKIALKIRKKRDEANAYNSVEYKNAIKQLIKLIEQSNQNDSGTHTHNAHDEKFQNFIVHLLNEHTLPQESFEESFNGEGFTYHALIYHLSRVNHLKNRLAETNASASLRDEYAMHRKDASRLLTIIHPAILKELSTDATDKALIEQKKLADYLREIIRIINIIRCNYGNSYKYLKITSSMLKHSTWISTAAYLTKKTSNPKHIEILHWAQKNFKHRLNQDLQRLAHALKNDYKDPINDLTGKIKKCQSRIPRITIKGAIQHTKNSLFSLLIELPVSASIFMTFKVARTIYALSLIDKNKS